MSAPVLEASRPRVVVLGASNVTLALRSIVEIARGVCDTPLEILTAHGHGRSYGTWSRAFFARDLPSIDACGVWSAIESRRASETFALVTDIGNDLVYGRRVDEIETWVARCLDRLRAVDARIVVTRLPIASLATLSPLRFRVVQSILFPARRIELSTLLAQARELDERVAQLVTSRGIALVEPRADWFGRDPIHVRRARRAAVFAEILAHWAPHGSTQSLSWHERRALHLARPEVRRIFGRTQTRAQPCVRFEDGSVYAAY